MFEIIGYQKVQFTNDESGEFVEGYKLFLKGDELTGKDSGGFSVITKFFTLKSIKGVVKEGAFCEFNISFNSKGQAKITGCTIS